MHSKSHRWCGRSPAKLTQFGPRLTQRETSAAPSATVLTEPSADLCFHLGRERAKVRLWQQPQHLNGQGKRLVIAIQAGEALLRGIVREHLLGGIVREHLLGGQAGEALL